MIKDDIFVGRRRLCRFGSVSADTGEDRMFTREKLRWLARYSYAKGVDLYERGKVSVFHLERDGKYARIRAEVQGSGRHTYEVELTVDREADAVSESFCECPAFYSYTGLCKHCVGVMLQYIAQQNREMEYGIRKKQAVAAPSARRKTTAQMKELLQRQTVRRTLPLLQSATCGKVRLEPILTCGRNSSKVEFRVGVKKMYVLKDVLLFARAMQEHQDLAYGKNLQFVHTMESFEPQSRKLAAFILDWVYRYEEGYRQFHPYGSLYFIGGQKIREMQLDEWGLDAFLDAVGSVPFSANIDGGGEKTWSVAEEELRRKVRLKGTADGMEISLDYLSGYECEHSFIYFRDSRIYRVSREKLGAAGEFLTCMRQLPGRKAFVQKEDMPAFLRQILPALKDALDCEMEDIREADMETLLPTFRFYLDMPQSDLVTCKALAVYGEKEYSIYDHLSDLELRDLSEEAQAGEVVGSLCNAYDENAKMMVISGEEQLVFQLLTEGIGKLQQLGEVYVSDALKRVRILQTPRFSVGLSLAGDLLDLRIVSEDLTREQLTEILSRYDRRKKFYRLKDGDIIRLEDEGLENLEEAAKVLQLPVRQWKKEVIQVPKYRALSLEEGLVPGQHFLVQKDDRFLELIRNMKTGPDCDFKVPESLQEIMREYQKQGYRWIRTLYQNEFGGILADDMGLGKTLQVICFLLSVMEEGRTPAAGGSAPLDRLAKGSGCALIVCPASLVYNWKKELERFAPALSVHMIIGTAAERKTLLREQYSDAVFITSYDLLRRDVELYQDRSFFCQVIDEAQYIKNHGTQAAKAVKQVRAAFRLALTGTPVENRLSELWSIFDYLMPGYLYAYQRFREELEYPIVHKEDEDAVARLQKMIRPFILRRLKQDVLAELPEKLEENMYAGLEGEQRELYDAHVKRIQLMLNREDEAEFRSGKIQILAELTKLRQLCCDPSLLYEGYQSGSAKLEMAMGLVRNAVGNGHKVLLFSQFTTMLSRLSDSLQKEHIPHYMLTGATSKEKRAQMVEEFDEGVVPVFCISLKAGGTGLNLTAADVVIHFDPWWNLAVQNQATDRAHRIGQVHTVNVYRLIAKDTIEEKIVELQERKVALADQILGGEGMENSSFTREELLELLS